MKTNVSFKNEIAKAIRPFRLLIYATGVVGIGLLFNSCRAGYIASEPTYVEVVRPSQPSNAHIWIDGDWNWNRRTSSYVQTNGYWNKPYVGKTYTSGQWQASPKGKYWQRGRWVRQSNRNRNSVYLVR